MLRKILSYFVFIFGISNVFSANSNNSSANPFSLLSDTFQQFFESILSNKTSLTVLIFIVMLIGFKQIISIGLNQMLSNHKKEAGIISFSISFLGTVGIFWIFRNNQEGYVALFGGTIGMFLLSILFLSVLSYIFSILKSNNARWYSYGLFLGIPAILILNLYIVILLQLGIGTSLISTLEGISAWIFIICLICLIALIIIKFFKRNSSPDGDDSGGNEPQSEDINMANITLKNIKNTTDEIKKKLTGIKNFIEGNEK